MARSSPASGGQSARAPKPPSKRVAARAKAGKGRTRTAQPKLSQPPETTRVAPTQSASKARASKPPANSEADSAMEAPRRFETDTAPVTTEAKPAAGPMVASAPEASEPVPEPAAAPAAKAAVAASPRPPAQGGAQAPDLTAIFRASRTLVEGSVRVRSQMLGFGCRQADHGFALGRAMLASGSLPEMMALQADYVNRAVDDALVQTLELSRLSTDVVRAGLESLRLR